MTLIDQMINHHDTALSVIYQNLISQFKIAVPLDFYSAQSDTPEVIVDVDTKMYQQFSWLKVSFKDKNEDIFTTPSMTVFSFLRDRMVYYVVYGDVDKEDIPTLQDHLRTVVEITHSEIYEYALGEW